MAFKLSRTEHKQREELLESLRTAAEAFTAVQEEGGNGLLERIAELIVVVQEAEAFRSEIASRLQEEFDEHSEAWQEGDRGSEAQEMIDAWDGADFSDPPLDNLADLELEDYVQTLEDLPTEI